VIRNNNRRDPMASTIRARFAKGVLEPLEHLDVPEGEVLTITIIRLPAKKGGGGLERSAGGWSGPSAGSIATAA
jgi:predicted DNA-binding antitoxin AbrB/MazE fold protein